VSSTDAVLYQRARAGKAAAKTRLKIQRDGKTLTADVPVDGVLGVTLKEERITPPSK
jgi:hypothetical protein